MTLDKAVTEACKEPTLLDALVWIAIWENQRAVEQAKKGGTWETCFKTAFTAVAAAYALRVIKAVGELP